MFISIDTLDGVREAEDYAAKLRKQKRDGQIAHKRSKAVAEEGKALPEEDLSRINPVLTSDSVPLVLFSLMNPG